jgi:HPr kinase/phosphorylase
MAAWTTQDVAGQLRGRLDLGDACGMDSGGRPFRTGRLQPVDPLAGGLALDPSAVPFLTRDGLGILSERPGPLRGNLFRTLAHSGVPCLLLTATPTIPPFLKRLSRRFGLPVLASPLEAPCVESRLTGMLRECRDGRKRVHGCLAVTAGVGILITGESGAGKTRAALGLAAGEDGAWVADDAVDLLRQGESLRGRAPASIRGLVALRGRGIVQVTELLSPSRIREEASIDGVVLLRQADERGAGWPEAGPSGETCRILGLKRPFRILCMEEGDPAGSRIARWAGSLRPGREEP